MNPKKFSPSFRVINFGEARVFIASTTLNFNKRKKKNQYDLVKSYGANPATIFHAIHFNSVHRHIKKTNAAFGIIPQSVISKLFHEQVHARF